MTDRQEDDVQLSEAAPEEGQAQTTQGSTVATEQEENQGDGQHGRPSDDADPGHS